MGYFVIVCAPFLLLHEHKTIHLCMSVTLLCNVFIFTIKGEAIASDLK